MSGEIPRLVSPLPIFRRRGLLAVSAMTALGAVISAIAIRDGQEYRSTLASEALIKFPRAYSQADLDLANATTGVLEGAIQKGDVDSVEALINSGQLNRSVRIKAGERSRGLYVENYVSSHGGSRLQRDRYGGALAVFAAFVGAADLVFNGYYYGMLAYFRRRGNVNQSVSTSTPS